MDTETRYDMYETVVQYSDPAFGIYGLLEMHVEESDEYADLYAEAQDEKSGEVTTTKLRLNEAGLLALIAAAERALDVIRGDS